MASVDLNKNDITSGYPRKQSMTISGFQVQGSLPKKRQDVQRWDGWGYKDCRFQIIDGCICYKGSRYPIENGQLPLLTEECRRLFDLNMDGATSPDRDLPSEDDIPMSIMPKEVIEAITALGVSCSTDHIDRLFRSHGQTTHDIRAVIKNEVARVADLVVWPTCHEEVVKVVELADRSGLVVVPVGGCTNVSRALEYPAEERRPIIALDTTQMNSILWVDEQNMVVCCEAGILGQDLEREMNKLGMTVGHEPDSYEFSTLGGWVATRASGMKKNTYGNIEDLLVHVRLVTPRGTLARGNLAPRMSCGPDFDHVALGSEGCLGVVTEAALKLRPLPVARRFASIAFPGFDEGVACLREVARRRAQPTSIRLMDKNQRRFGQSMRGTPGMTDWLLDYVRKLYLSMKGVDYEELCLATMYFEGDDAGQLAQHEATINQLAKKYGGIAAGAGNGEKGYLLTFVIAYLRDVSLDMGVIAESFETSVPWDMAMPLYKNVERAVAEECRLLKVPHFSLAYRLTQSYDAGCCLYFYMGIRSDGVQDPFAASERLEECARDEIIKSGGSISHHHGVGKLRKKWYKQTVSEVGFGLLQATKTTMDPNNVFAIMNLI